MSSARHRRKLCRQQKGLQMPEAAIVGELTPGSQGGRVVVEILLLPNEVHAPATDGGTGATVGFPIVEPFPRVPINLLSFSELA